MWSMLRVTQILTTVYWCHKRPKKQLFIQNNAHALDLWVLITGLWFSLTELLKWDSILMESLGHKGVVQQHSALVVSMNWRTFFVFNTSWWFLFYCFFPLTSLSVWSNSFYNDFFFSCVCSIEKSMRYSVSHFLFIASGRACLELESSILCYFILAFD